MATFIAATALAGAAAAAAIAFAPAALADRSSRGDSDSASSSQVDRGPHKATPAQRGGSVSKDWNFAGLPKGWTNEAQWARPGMQPFGTGPKPPPLALD